MIAAHNIPDPEFVLTADKAGPVPISWVMTKSLEDDDGPIGLLMLGPRSDGNRYNRSEREALDEVLTPIAEALRFSRRRSQAEIIRSFEARLAQLETSAVVKPS